MEINLKRFILTLITILAVSVCFDLISTKFFDKSLVFKIVSKLTLILAVFYIIKKESFLSQSQKSICNYRIVYLILSLGLLGLSYYYLQSEITSLEVTIGKYQNLVFLLRSEEHTSELQSRGHLVCRLLLEKKKTYNCVNHMS